MRKQERRAYICLLLALVLFIGVCVFGARFVKEGGEWASFYGNSQIYTDGMINRRKMMNWLFVFVILCLLLFGFIGYKRGLVKSVVASMRNRLSMLALSMFSAWALPSMFDWSKQR